ncbi:YhgE/Pip domain-containing protein [Clostridium felsineum]|uniref:ABC-2 type transporter transmembrane domain-containing protein n=1 Tax=Clostridium felsineum TaxID=36839 RepID=A0A1S8L615_9CLOT|nr:YhgE/Pip domain-containing protein [Clostridium felsineum]URZ08695.1 hypothetical protein CLROS_040890 [Clostridium felsineum]URZ13725.1 hypothetical protein CROST_045030 [Clostridium felsineum]
MKLKELKSNKSFIWKTLAITTIAIMFIPMMYSLFYLKAFWDPYGSLKQVPVAIVNQDKSYSKDGKSYTLGKDLVKKLKDDPSMKWEFVNYNKAKEGVTGTDYYAMIVIPKDFSEKIANSSTGDFKKPKLEYIANKGRNFIFSQLSSKAAESMQNQISTKIAKQTSEVLVDKLYDVKNSIKDASTAQNKIQDGTQKLVNGSGDLSNGLNTAYTGSQALKTGLDTAATGSNTLGNGLLQLSNGNTTITNGLGSALKGSSDLQNGLNQLSNGQAQIVKGSGDLLAGLTAFKTQLSKGTDMNELKKATSTIAQSSNNIINNSKATVTNATTANSEIDSAIAALNKGDSATALSELQKAKNSTTTIVALNAPSQASTDNITSITTIDTAVSAVSGQVQSTLAQTQKTMGSAIDKFIDGANKINQGSTQVYNGLNSAATGANSLSSGLSKLYDGSNKIQTGLNSAYTGSQNLTTGLNTAASKTGELSSGLGTLNDGSKTLNSGLGTLNDGAIQLKNGLNDGYNTINNNLKFTSTGMANFVSNPISLSDKSINKVSSYGEGLAPYFISLSLWLGAMFINLIISVVSMLNLTKNKFLNSFVGKLIVGIGLVTIQSIMLTLSLQLVLGMTSVNNAYFYLNNVFTSIVFFSIMYGLSTAFGVMATPISFVLLILQLSSCAGTFPIETAPVFYRVVNKVIPMTYTVKVIRMVLSGINYSDLSHNLLVLLSFIVIFLLGGFGIKTLRSSIKNGIANENAENAA